MPSDAFWKSLYPSDWNEVSKRVREEAGQRCEQCFAPNGTWITRIKGTGLWTVCVDEDKLDEATWFDTCAKRTRIDRILYVHELSKIKVVLTVAHLDQDPRNNERGNLKALCQRCHLCMDTLKKNKDKRAQIRAELEHGQATLF